jgi:hypothetical protein
MTRKNFDAKKIDGFKLINVKDWNLFVHEKNYYSTTKNSSFEIHILGCFAHPDFQNTLPESFAEDVLGLCDSIDDINKALYKACGRFVVFVASHDEIFIRADAVSLGQVYYDKERSILCTDIKLYEHLTDNNEENIEAKKFLLNTLPFKGNGDAWIGDETIYAGLYKLLPNHALKLSDFSVARYWPILPRKETYLSDNIEILAKNLKDTLQAFQNLAPLSVAVTAGNDSRLALAASKTLRGECYYFIDKIPKMKNGDTDIVIGQKLCDITGVSYNVHTILPENSVPVEFRDNYYKNTFFAKPDRVAVAYKYYQDLSKYINICGVGEFGRSVFGNGSMPVSENYLCHKYHYTNSKFANRMTKRWLKQYQQDFSLLGYNVFALFYIEQKLGNWGAVGNSETDLAFEEINPYASHFMIDKFLSLPKNETTYIDNKLFYELTAFFDKSLLSIPINPVHNFKKKVGKFIKSTFLFPYIDYILFLYKSSRIGEVD